MKAKLQFISTMLIFGSIGIFVRNIDLSSAALAMIRGILGSLILIAYCLLTRQKFSFRSIKQNILLLIFSSTAMAFNWIFLFQSYKYTTIANATLSYYCAPIFVTIFSPVLLKEKLSIYKLGCVVTAMIGMILIMNNSGIQNAEYNHLKGILFGLCAAALYASVILTNKIFKDLGSLEATLIQLTPACVLLPYVAFTEPLRLSAISMHSILYILILGFFHTGFAYLLYFKSIKNLSAQSIAAFSYIDPISAVIFSAFLLCEPLTLLQIIGGILILSSTILSDIKIKSKQSL
jgi:drug/metabolite transporter (DMT)-like permease